MNTNVTVSFEENEKLSKLFTAVNHNERLITIYAHEISGDDCILCLENNLTCDLIDVRIPVELLELWINESGENKIGKTVYGTDSILYDVAHIEPALQWWEDANLKDQYCILKHNVRGLLRETVK